MALPPPLREQTTEKPDPRAALLRWRLRWLLPPLPPKTRMAARFLPVLLQASFERAEFRSEAPGIEGMKIRPGWGILSRDMGLSPPISMQRGRRLVRAVVALPGPRLRLLVVPQNDIGKRELEMLQLRVQAARSFLAPHGTEVELCMAPHALDLWMFGILIAGQLPTSFWQDVETQLAEPLNHETIFRWASHSPTSLCTYLLLLTVRNQVPSPAQVLHQELQSGTYARKLADPEYLLCRWAQQCTPHGSIVSQALATGAVRPAVRKESGHIEPAPAQDELLRQGRALWVHAAKAARTFSLPAKKTLMQTLRKDAPLGLPSFYIRHLLGQLSPTLKTPQRTAQGLYEVVNDKAVRLSLASKPEHAIVRALSLQILLGVDCKVLPAPMWHKVLQRLRTPIDVRRILLVTLPRERMTDPIEKALWVVFRPGFRPSARVISNEAILQHALFEIARGVPIEVAVGMDESDPAAARLDRVLIQTAAARRLSDALALQTDDFVLCVKGNRVHRVRRKHFFSRPRQHIFISNDPTVTHTSIMGRRWSSATIECEIFASDSGQAVIEYMDGLGNHFREEVPISHLDAHIRDTQRLLRQLPTPGLLAIRASAQVATLAARKFELYTLDVAVTGELPTRLKIQLRTDATSEHPVVGYRAISEWLQQHGAVASTLRINMVEATLSPRKEMSSSLYLLYVRSVVTRRTLSHLKNRP